MRRVHVSLGLFCSLLVVAFPLLARNPDQQHPATANLGVSVVMADGSSETIPVQEKMSAVIPTPGAKGVFGVQLEPYMSGRRVAVHVRAVKGNNWAEAKGPSLQTARIRGTKTLGSYVIGEDGDSIQLADLAQFGLAPLTLKVVNAQSACGGDGDPCLLCDNGIVCCWSNPQQQRQCIALCGSASKTRTAKGK